MYATALSVWLVWRVALEPAPRIAKPSWENALGALALERIYRLRRRHVHLIVFAFGLPILGAVLG
jgi:hypothetical protein